MFFYLGYLIFIKITIKHLFVIQFLSFKDYVKQKPYAAN